MKIVSRISLPVDQTWQLIADLEAQEHWLGLGAHLRPIQGTRVSLCDATGQWRSGSVTAARRNEKIVCRLSPQQFWSAEHSSTRLTISLAPHQGGGTTLTIDEEGLMQGGSSPSPHEESLAFWSGAISRFAQLVGYIVRRRRNPRQAVIVIHGIGEQQPGVTLRNFVKGVLGSDTSTGQWSKPDRMSPLFELRQITVQASDKQERPTTDIFELYWAHLVHDTTLSQVISWLRHLILRKSVPKRFRFIRWAGSIFMIALLLLIVSGAWPILTAYLAGGSVLVVALTMFWRLLGKSFVINSIGDAARYLTPRPANIEHRQAIREGGVDLLDSIHAQGRYDRIVVVGHSLGSVIAYDIITQYWIRTHRRHLRPPKVSNREVGKLERELDELDAESGQKLQYDAWGAIRSNTQPWLITDLVTLGSPLSMADFLMAETEDDFHTAMRNRELPKCPPIPEVQKNNKRISFDRGYTDRFGGQDKTFRYLHHAAPFAVTRWTNLYFATSLVKDPIGGPVAPLFGRWVNDVKLESPPKRPYFLHTRYWSGGKDSGHLDELRKALHLESGQELISELENHPPLLYLPNHV